MSVRLPPLPADRHRQPRAAFVECPATLGVAGRSFACWLMDLSEDGAKLRCAQGLPEGSIVTVTVEPFEPLEGRIAWHDAGVMGVFFFEECQPSARTIRRFVEDGRAVDVAQHGDRHPVIWPATLRGVDGSLPCIVLNVSAGGATVLLDAPRPLTGADRLVIERVGSFRCGLAWQQGDRVGLRFAEGAEEVTAAIAGRLPPYHLHEVPRR
ncbi:MAG: PilZ domain-containing protein [Inquilinaceae bacterium]